MSNVTSNGDHATESARTQNPSVEIQDQQREQLHQCNMDIIEQLINACHKAMRLRQELSRNLYKSVLLRELKKVGKTLRILRDSLEQGDYQPLRASVEGIDGDDEGTTKRRLACLQTSFEICIIERLEAYVASPLVPAIVAVNDLSVTSFSLAELIVSTLTMSKYWHSGFSPGASEDDARKIDIEVTAASTSAAGSTGRPIVSTHLQAPPRYQDNGFDDSYLMTRNESSAPRSLIVRRAHV